MLKVKTIVIVIALWLGLAAVFVGSPWNIVLPLSAGSLMGVFYAGAKSGITRFGDRYVGKVKERKWPCALAHAIHKTRIVTIVCVIDIISMWTYFVMWVIVRVFEVHIERKFAVGGFILPIIGLSVGCILLDVAGRPYRCGNRPR